MLEPDDFTGERHLGERLHLLISSDIEKLFAVLFTDFDPVPTPLELITEGPDKLTFGIEDKDRRVILSSSRPS